MPMSAILDPDRTEFLWISMEGFDPYSQVGGLATRVTGLTSALAAHGFPTWCSFCGDPALPFEQPHQTHLTLIRFAQHLNRQYPEGVYAGETVKARHLEQWLPEWATHHIIRPALARGRRVIVVAEEWQTVPALIALSDELWRLGLRDQVTCVWNANNDMGFDTIDWSRLQYVSHITTVSRFMHHVLRARGVGATVMANGIPDSALVPADPGAVQTLRHAFTADLRLFKIGRYDPDKRWMMALDALAQLRRDGVDARLLIRGDRSPYGDAVRRHASALDLAWAQATDTRTLAQRSEPIVELIHRIDEDTLRALYQAADAVLAHSEMEPFGLVGLEVMAQGGVVVVGSTGEDYALAYDNALVVNSDDPAELAAHLQALRQFPDLGRRLAAAGPQTARRFHWDRIVPGFLYRMQQFTRALK